MLGFFSFVGFGWWVFFGFFLANGGKETLKSQKPDTPSLNYFTK